MERKRGRFRRLNLGSSTTVPLDDIIGIFDMDTATVSNTTKEFLNQAQSFGDITSLGQELPKSFIVIGRAPMGDACVHGGVFHCAVALSQFSPRTLIGREDE
ncbi:MAG: DUF370 domain-containing protein [Clostridia bacterium]|nr:DUF370 domain-containing protein [Clostridia bacterium]